MFTFSKEERLKSKVAIDQLFKEGTSFHVPMFMVVHSPVYFESGYPARILISVPRRKIKRAVGRNLLKRRIREAYRLHKHTFYEMLAAHSSKCTLALVYTSGEAAGFKEIEEKIILILKRLEREYEKAAR